jgi:hypothetical protein
VTCIGGLSVVCASDCIPPTWFGLAAIVVVEFALPMPNDGAVVVVEPAAAAPFAGVVLDDVDDGEPDEHAAAVSASNAAATSARAARPGRLVVWLDPCTRDPRLIGARPRCAPAGRSYRLPQVST